MEGWAKPKQKNQTGNWLGQNGQEKSAAPKIKGNNNALEKTTLFPHGTKPFRYGPKNDNEETQLLALGQTFAQRDKSEDDKEANGSSDDQNGLLDDLSE
jgi:hypothetical protein